MNVYLIHFDEPYQHARHYLGVAHNVDERLRQHRRGRSAGGARLMEVVTQAGITWRLARTWNGGRDLERQLKGWNNGCRLCPICKAERLVAQALSTISEEDAETETSLWS